MIKSAEPLTMSESLGYASGAEGDVSEIKGFIKKFPVLKEKDALEMSKKLDGLGLIKLNKENIVKVVDLLPEDSDDLNKIFSDVNLDEDETKKILEVVKEFK